MIFLIDDVFFYTSMKVMKKGEKEKMQMFIFCCSTFTLGQNILYKDELVF